MSLKIVPLNTVKIQPVIFINNLPKEILLKIFELLYSSSSKEDLKACRLVCKNWRLLNDHQIFDKLLDKRYCKWVETALLRVESLSKCDKFIASTKNAKLAEIIGQMGDIKKALELLNKSLVFADQIGWSSEYCDEDGSKPQEYDDDRVICYLKIIQAFACIRRISEITNYMKSSKQAFEIASSYFRGQDIQIYTDLARVFIPVGGLEEIIGTLKQYGYGKDLVVKAIKTYAQEPSLNQLFLSKLDSIYNRNFKEAYWYARGRSIHDINFYGLARCLEVIKGYCLIGQLDKALEIIKNVEEGKDRLGERTSREWLSKAYVTIAKAIATKGDAEKVQELSAKITDTDILFKKWVIISIAYIKRNEYISAEKMLAKAKEEAVQIKHLRGCKALLEIAKVYFQMGRLNQTLRLLDEAEIRANEPKNYEPHYQSEAFLRLIEMARHFKLDYIQK